MLKLIWCNSESTCDDFDFFDTLLNIEYFYKITIATVQQRREY